MTASCITAAGRWQYEIELTSLLPDIVTTRSAAVDDNLGLILTGERDNATLGIAQGVAWRIAQSFNAAPDTAQAVLGRTSGTIDALADDDNSTYNISAVSFPRGIVQSVAATFEGVMPIDEVSSGVTRLDSIVRASTSSANTTMQIQLWDWTTSSWTAGPNAPISNTESQVAHGHVSNGRYIQVGTRRVRARIITFTVGVPTSRSTTIRIDQVKFQSDT